MIESKACEICGSSDNVKVFENGSEHCFTPGCTYHKGVGGTDETNIPKELISGVFGSLPNRRISQRTCEVFNYMQGTYNGQPCHIACIFDDSRKMVAQQIRLPNKQFLMLGNTSNIGLVGLHLWGRTGKSIVITEGYIDMLSIAESQDCKWPVVTVPNGAQSAVKAIKKDLDKLLGYDSVVLCFDNDEAGQKALEDCVGLFPPGKVKIAKLSEKDANDCLVKGKTKELTNIVFTASEYRPDGIIWGDEIEYEKLFEQQPRGLRLPYPILDERIRGLKKGRIYTIYAGTGCGKSTAMREIALGLQGKHRIANIFLEEGLGFTALSYIAMSNNIPPYKIEENPKLLTIEQKEKGKELIKNMAFYRHFGSIDSQRLFNLLEYLVIGKGVEVVFLDHISLLISGMRSQDGDRKDLDILMTNLRSFTERTQAIVICATQLKRKQKSYNEGEDITEADSRGSGAIEHISDVIFSLNCNRNDDSPNDAQIKILKNRITGQLGDADLISYNEKTGRYLPKNPIKEAHQNDKNDFSEDLI